MFDFTSTEDLQYEIDRRKLEIDKRKKIAANTLIPKLIKSPDFIPLQNLCKKYLDDIIEDAYLNDGDYKQWFFETSMETFFGKDVWNFINSKG